VRRELVAGAVASLITARWLTINDPRISLHHGASATAAAGLAPNLNTQIGAVPIRFVSSRFRTRPSAIRQQCAPA
jgi:hypothetical protein